MPKIYRNEKGELVKEGSNGCETCGLPTENQVVLKESPAEAVDEPNEADAFENTDEVIYDDN